MKIGILECGLVNDKLSDRFEPYPVMFQCLLKQAGRDFEYQSYSVVQSVFPDSVRECDGWLITGSRHGVYETLDWIEPLEQFVRRLAGEKIPLVGICFGHEVIAKALGGEVINTGKWGVGLHQYSVDKQQPWMNGEVTEVAMHAFHQDQVTRCPPGAEVYLSAQFCRNAGFVFGESIMTLQGHPEMDRDYQEALLDLFGGNKVPIEAVDKARGSLQGVHRADTCRLASWIAEFLLSTGS